MRTTTVVLAAMLVCAQGVLGQACLGVPQGSEGSVSVGLGFPDGGKTYALSGLTRSGRGGPFLSGGFAVTVPDRSGENVKSISGRAAFEISALTPSVSVCPTFAIGYGWVGAVNDLTIPFGAGIGGTIPLGVEEEGGFTPYVVPQFLYARSWLDDVDDSAASDVFVGVVAGLTIDYGPFIFGGEISKIFEEGADAQTSIHVGVAW